MDGLAAQAALEESGFVVLPGPFPVEQLGAVADAYDAEVRAAVGDDIRAGSTSTRVVDFVNRGPLFDPLYVYPPLLDAVALTVGQTFKLSSPRSTTRSRYGRKGSRRAGSRRIHANCTRD